MTRVRNILLLTPMEVGYARDVARGVIGHPAAQNDWHVTVTGELPADITGFLRRDHFSGIIGFVRRSPDYDAMRAWGGPVITVSNYDPPPDLSRVGVDDEAVGRTAARHLLATGVREFAYFGWHDGQHSAQRYGGFSETIRAAGFPCHAWLGLESGRVAALARRNVSVRAAETTAGGDWLAKLPKPLGVFAFDDRRAMQAAALCRWRKLRVPEDVAIVGVNNDEFFCEASSPRLSSVAVPGVRIGHRAADLLAELMDGGRRKPPARPGPVLLPPTRVVVRQSTDIVAVQDPVLAEALAFIRQNVHRPVGVAQVVEAVGVSRSTLEARFRHGVGRTPLEEIHRVRLEAIRRLLAESTLPLRAVARQTGVSGPQRLVMFFKAKTGQTPETFRRLARGGA